MKPVPLEDIARITIQIKAKVQAIRSEDVSLQ